jgi:dipeptidyl aminopeptidase/acylaminoacyl peptidase
MNKYIYHLLIAVIFILIGWFANTAYSLFSDSTDSTSRVELFSRSKQLAKYTIENLSKAEIKPVEIQIGKILKENPKFTSYQFSMTFSPDFSQNLKTTSGLINIPKGNGKFPIIVMFRGYVDPKEYFIGNGTIHAAEYFASNGFITIAPDFLGYGESDKEADDIFESRFQTYATAITLLKSLDHSTIQPFNYSSVFIWGHSNGGQIALTALEATGLDYPTVLWAPVTKPFPYSILYYTDDAEDGGKFLRKKLSEFEKDYDTDLFSLTKYLANIKAPIQLNQGTADTAVPAIWSNQFAKDLTELKADLKYIKYPGSDHNMSPTWNQAISNALDFYKKHIE